MPPVILSSSWVAGKVVVRVAGGLADGLVAGDHVQMSGRLYIVTSNMISDGSFAVLPAVLPRLADECFFQAPFAVARIDREKDGLASTHNPDFSGPWSIPWNENV